MAWVATASEGINGEMVRDVTIQWFAASGSPLAASATVDLATTLDLVPCFTLAGPHAQGRSAGTREGQRRLPPRCQPAATSHSASTPQTKDGNSCGIARHWQSAGSHGAGQPPRPGTHAAGSRCRDRPRHDLTLDPGLCARDGVADPTLSSQEQRLVAGRRSLGSGEGALGPPISGCRQPPADDRLPARHIGRHDMPARATLLAELFQAA
jgi:hypothetical protein